MKIYKNNNLIIKKIEINIFNQLSSIIDDNEMLIVESMQLQCGNSCETNKYIYGVRRWKYIVSG